jgi:hypothetical protein
MQTSHKLSEAGFSFWSRVDSKNTRMPIKTPSEPYQAMAIGQEIQHSL